MNNATTLRKLWVESGLLIVQEFDGFGGSAPEPTWSILPRRSWYWGVSIGGLFEGPIGRWHAGLLCAWNRTSREYGVSLAYPVLLTSIPAALLWYADRRCFGPGRCPKCGYDRAGIAADSPCPECGTTPV